MGGQNHLVLNRSEGIHGLEAFREWEGRGRGYLNTASYGLPPAAAVAAAAGWITEWKAGSAPLSSWLPATDAARGAFARLTGLDQTCVATGTSVSQLVGCIAASIRDGSLVLAEEAEFTSLLFPFLAQEDRRVAVELVPKRQLLAAAAQRGDVVAFSLVGSADGEVRDGAALAAAVRGRGALTVVDAAQACGWLAADYTQFDFVVCPAFKWLCSPRGTAFMAIRTEHLEWLRPSAAGWFAAADRARLFGAPLELATSARRLDLSPVWNSWVPTAAALATIEAVGVPAIAEHSLRLANRLRAELGHIPTASPIVIVEAEAGAAKLLESGLKVSQVPAGARLAFHAGNSDADVDRVLEVLVGS